MLRPDWAFQPVGVTAIEKANGKGLRFISAGSFEVRLAERALLDVVGPLIYPSLSLRSFGLPKRGGLDALRDLQAAMASCTADTLLTMDIMKCFDLIPVNSLLKILLPLIRNQRIMALLEADFRSRPSHHAIRLLKHSLLGIASAKDTEHLEGLHQNSRGIRQGSAISPLACVLYLQPVLQAVTDQLPSVHIIHYIDNFGFLAHSGCQDQLRQLVEQATAKLGLEPVFDEPIHREVGGTAQFLGYEVNWTNGVPSLTVSGKTLLKLAVKLRACVAKGGSLWVELRKNVLPALAYFRLACNQDAMRQVIRTELVGFPVESDWLSSATYRFSSGPNSQQSHVVDDGPDVGSPDLESCPWVASTGSAVPV
jgi:hypothetical protein